MASTYVLQGYTLKKKGEKKEQQDEEEKKDVINKKNCKTARKQKKKNETTFKCLCIVFSLSSFDLYEITRYFIFAMSQDRKGNQIQKVVGKEKQHLREKDKKENS